MGRAKLLLGDCMKRLAEIEEGSIDACITDPPYHLESMVKRFGGKNAAPARFGKDGASARKSARFMGKTWDGGDIAQRPETWAEVYRVLKPGAFLLAFSATRTYHRMSCAIEDAGFEVRDMIPWVHGQGLPFSKDVAKEAAKRGKDLSEWAGWGTALKPSVEPICLARKPLAGTTVQNVEKHGTGALNIDASKIGSDGKWPANFVTDGSDLVAANLPAQATGFFYSAKPSPAERGDNEHPTVKPLALMRYLCRLVTGPGGTVLDPFMGSGTTGVAATSEGFHFVGIEMEADSYNTAMRRISERKAA